MAVRVPVRLPYMYFDIAAKNNPIVSLNNSIGEIGTKRTTGLSAIHNSV